MRVPNKSSSSKNVQAYLEKSAEREEWHKLVVKVISWKGGLVDGGVVKQTDKISSAEWDEYCKRTIKTNVTYSKERVLSTLDETKKAIAHHGGFAK